jgi:enoyl-[acyl-carrier protein] reductase II
VIHTGIDTADRIAVTIDSMRSGKNTDRPYAVNVPLYRKGIDEVLDLLAERRVPILIASQGGPRRYIDRFKAIDTKCIHVVAGEEHAYKAVEAGIDGLVVLGAEAGGYPPPELLSTLVVVRSVVRAVGPQVPIIASGGFADGAGLAAALSLGAGAANFGTRFIATPQANVHPAYKEALINAAVSSTTTVGRDLGMIRTLSNAFAVRMLELEREGADIDRRRTVFSASTLMMAALYGDTTNGKVELGQSAGLVDTTKMPAIWFVE